MIIFVNATAASEIGGLKTIVDQFIDSIKYYDNKNTYYIFVSPNYTYSDKVLNCNFIEIEAKATLQRLKWDYFGMRKWAKFNSIFPDKIISLQNTGVLFNKVEQIIYLHTPIPFVKYNWNFFKKNERRLWFYKNIYPYFIKTTLNKNTSLVVQSNWLKSTVSAFLNISEKRVVVNVPTIHEESNTKNVFSNRSGDKNLYFYPAADYKYKNHDIIIDALKLLKKNNFNRYEDIEVIFTLDKKSHVYELAMNAGVVDKVTFTGKLDKKQMIHMYQISHAILFPSYVETFGLPLIEAAALGKTIYCSEEKYSHEVVGEYKGVKFIKPFEPEQWERAFSDDYQEHPVFKGNQSYESWKELFRRIKHETC
ncbi:glycosyltransferase [Priestia aryabhattai]|uniref:glycosyltransferase n=1 Tax=Priestia aryabhattai TaxID=412384 RepID=UPI002E21380A|nr:glycosyltransferase [Priestia aryabhattai]MED4013705.1 glycosyltransferase [Priestia aryabhattai]